MTQQELETRCVKLFGKKHWKSNLAKIAARDFTTVRRWCRGVSPVPRHVEVLLDAIETQRRFERLSSAITKQLK